MLNMIKEIKWNLKYKIKTSDYKLKIIEIKNTKNRLKERWVDTDIWGNFSKFFTGKDKENMK